MVNTQSHLAQLKVAIQQLHNCGAVHLKTVPVPEVFQGQTVGQHEVEVFNLINHPTAKRCYGWTDGEPEDFITILELPPVTDAQSAVKVAVAYQIEKAK
jgi:hypothetical protein